MGPEPRSVAPGDGAITTGDNLVTSDSKLNLPLVGEHLPYDKAASLGDSGVSDLIHGPHFHLSGGKDVLDRPFQLPAAGGGGEVLDNILSGGGKLVEGWWVRLGVERDGEERACEDAEENLEVGLLVEEVGLDPVPVSPFF